MIEVRLGSGLLARLREQESHYDEQAYLFVLEGIEYLQQHLTARRHVTGVELARACRDHALEQFGLMSQPVLRHWGIRRTEDIGRIVFALVEVGLLVTQTTDREEDFRGVFDFDDAFSTSYVWPGITGRSGAERTER